MTPWAAARIGITQEMPYIGYTGVFNMLGESKFERVIVSSCKDQSASRRKKVLVCLHSSDLPSCTFPVTFADKQIDKARDDSQWQASNHYDAKIQADYDPEFYHGTPVSLQVVGQRLQDEKVLEMVHAISSVLTR